jgi:hypothetical protein
MSLGLRVRKYKGENMDLSNLINGVQPEESVQGGALPTGNYNVKVEKVEGKTTKAGGKALNIQMRVFGEKYNNAVLFDFVNIEHPTSPKAADIGKARIAKIAQLLGSTDTSSWLGKELSVFASKETSQEWGDQNRVKAYNEYVVDTTPLVAKANTSVTADEIPF